MFQENNLEIIKMFVQTQVDTYPDGVIFAIIKNDIITWKITSHFTLDTYEVGKSISNSTIDKAIQTKQAQTAKEFDSDNEMKISINAIPILDEEEVCRSVFVTVTPVVHPVQKGFRYFAPIIQEIFKEGSLITMTNQKEVQQVQRSEKYDIEAIVPGFDITTTAVDVDAMTTRNFVHSDDDTLLYGPPIRVLVAPYFDEDTNEVLGVVNILRPKQAELDLKNLSTNLERQLAEVSLTIQEIANASTDIHSNEQEVNKEIEDITDLANEIVEISNMIKSIADSTKMLGLNASIEAARAGTVGRGFGVVAVEINKLSEQSRNTVPKIQKLTEDIIVKVKESKRKSHNSLASSQEQVAATEEITATIEDIQAASVELVDIANRI